MLLLYANQNFKLTKKMIKLLPVLILIIIWLIINPSPYCLLARRKYKKSEYFRLTGNPYLSTVLDKGRYGEYLTYRKLLKPGGDKKFLFNIYIPKPDNTASEIDVLLIHESGLYVLESKNYSGWIFGMENQRYWTQTIPRQKGRPPEKNRFYNPVLQNRGHIKALKSYLEDESLPVRSIIVFSERCELKKVEISRADCIVVKRDELAMVFKNCIKLSKTTLPAKKAEEIYSRLYPLTQADAAQKQEHIDNINKKYARRNS